jgi:hypothetical protein
MKNKKAWASARGEKHSTKEKLIEEDMSEIRNEK